jgi:hypothetical protein
VQPLFGTVSFSRGYLACVGICLRLAVAFCAHNDVDLHVSDVASLQRGERDEAEGILGLRVDRCAVGVILCACARVL